LAEKDTEGVFLIWSEVRSNMLADEREVSKERLWELGLEREQLEAIKEGIRLGALQVLKTDHGVVDLIDFQKTTLDSRKRKEVTAAARGISDRNAQNASAPSQNNVKDASTKTGEVDNKYDQGNQVWNVVEILAHRPPESTNGPRTDDYLVEWAGDFKSDHERYDWRPKNMVSEDLIDAYWGRRAEIEAASKIGDENAEAAAAAAKEAKEKKGKKQRKKRRGKH
jgi:hypothetical protein